MMISMVPMAMADETPVLTWLFVGDNNVPETCKVMEEFEARMGVDIQYTYINSRDLDTKLNTLIAGDNLPDIFLAKNQIAIDLAEGGKLLEEFQALSAEEQAALLDQDVDREGAKRENSIIQNIEDSLQVDAADRFDEIGDDKLYTKENNGRLFAVDLAFRIWKDYPVFGTGYGTFGTSASLTWVPDIYYDYDMLEGFYADNQFACVLVETGVVGFVLSFFVLRSHFDYNKRQHPTYLCNKYIMHEVYIITLCVISYAPKGAYIIIMIYANKS